MREMETIVLAKLLMIQAKKEKFRAGLKKTWKPGKQNWKLYQLGWKAESQQLGFKILQAS